MIKSRLTAHDWPKMTLTMLAFAFCFAASLPALAQSGLNGLVKTVNASDKNFDMADRNHDGLLSKDEAKAGNVPFIVDHFDAIDTQHRGLVSKQEVHAFILRSIQKQSQPASASSSEKPD
ncbi:MAG: EF-hand domain-containing protein [Rhodanobacter sp.]